MTSKLFLDYVNRTSTTIKKINNIDVKVVYVPTLLLDLIKTELLELFDALDDISFGKQTSDDLFNQSKQNKHVTWCILYNDNIIGVATTEVKRYPRLTSFFVTHISVAENIFKDFRIEFKNFFEDTGKKFECDILEFMGRPGWKRWTDPEGFSNNLYVYRKKLKGVNVV